MGKNELIQKISNDDALLESAAFDTNSFSEKEMQLLSVALKKNTHLKYLHFGYTHFPREAVLYLSEALTENKTLVSLSLDEFDDDSDKVKQALRNIKECLDRNQHNGNGYRSHS